jgi:hypothetical protein
MLEAEILFAVPGRVNNGSLTFVVCFINTAIIDRRRSTFDQFQGPVTLTTESVDTPVEFPFGVRTPN